MRGCHAFVYVCNSRWLSKYVIKPYVNRLCGCFVNVRTVLMARLPIWGCLAQCNMPLSVPSASNKSSNSSRPVSKTTAPWDIANRVSYLNTFLQQQLLQERGSLITGAKSARQWSVWPERAINLRYADNFRKAAGITATKADLHLRNPIQRSHSFNSRSQANHAEDTKEKAAARRRHSLPVYTNIETLYSDRLQVKVRFASSLGSYISRMGQTLSEPVTKKETSSDENHTLKVGASCMQGWRITMEDEHVHKLCLNDEKDSHFFAVFDGHGGQATAQFSAKHLDNCIVSHTAYRSGDIAAACKGGFLATDEQLYKESVGKEDSSGSTAVSVLLKGNKLYCANAGDSRAVASVRGHAQLLSFDHKPNHEREMQRINSAGGFVEFNRVNGNLALSRALGDFTFKKNDHLNPEEQIVTADPDVICKEITKDHEFIVLACDGIWDVLSNKDVIEFVRERLAQKMEPEMVCEELMDKCLASECAMGGVGCDNMTVIIVALKQNGSFDELCKKCAVPKRDPIPPSCLLASYPEYVKGGISCL